MNRLAACGAPPALLPPLRLAIRCRVRVPVRGRRGDLVLPFALPQPLIDHGFATVSGGDRGAIDTYFLALFGIALVLAVFTAARFYMVSWLGERITADLRNAVFAEHAWANPAYSRPTDGRGAVAPYRRHDLVQTVIGVGLGMACATLSCSPAASSCLVVPIRAPRW